MWAIIAIVLFAVWLLSLLAFKITGALLHLLLLFAVVSLVMQFVRRKSAP
jgi:hypothetical protein